MSTEEIDEKFDEYIKSQHCANCFKPLNIPDLIEKKQCENLIIINYHNDQKENMNASFCCKECLNSFDQFGPIHCVLCDKPRETTKWDMKIKFQKLGGWISVRALCSEQCLDALKQTTMKDPGMKVNISCWYCNKLHEKSIPKCSKCKIATYCDEICQKRDWHNHKKNCYTGDGPKINFVED
jgi:hypothetical protein